MRLRVLIVSAALPLALWAVLPLGSHGALLQSGDPDRIQRKIDVTRGKIGRRRGTERVLSTEVAAYSQRIGLLSGRIDRFGRRQAVVETDLRRKQAELTRLQEELRAERRRILRLRARLAQARRALARRMVELYEATPPDMVTVVFSARGFADLLERGEFLERISQQDGRIIEIVRRARADAVATERTLDRLEDRQRRVTAIVAARRDEIARLKQGLIDTRVGLDGTRADKSRALASVRTDRHELEGHLASLRREQAQVRARLARASTTFAGVPGGGGGGGSGSGRLIWPVNGPITGSFGEARPGHMHAGIDIAAPGGTPIRAADGGRVVLLGFTGGYGNYTCVQHTASMSTCYAHQSSYATSMGASVSQGQVIGYVGSTGHSTGNHLHFEVRMGGSPVSPLAYL